MKIPGITLIEKLSVPARVDNTFIFIYIRTQYPKVVRNADPGSA